MTSTPTSKPRLPRAEINSVLARLARRVFGQVPDPTYLMWHNRRVLWAALGYERRVARFNRLDPQLKAYAELAAAGVIGCSWCLDFGYFHSARKGLDLDKLSQVPRWRTAEVFDDLERDVLEFAEAMTQTPPAVTDELFARLDERLGHAAMIELATMVALENQRSRLNTALGLTSQGFSDACTVPLARAVSG